MQERSYQLEAEEASLSNFDKNVRRQLLNMATGTGKTIVFGKLLKRFKSRLPGQAIVLAHREELIKQSIEKIHLVCPEFKVDEERAEHKADPSTADVIVASVASLGRKGTSRVDKYNWEHFDKLIVDEAHHATADSYRNIFHLFGTHREGNKLLLGVTATPQRSDGKALAEIFQKIVYVYSIRQAIEDGWLVDVRGFRVHTGTNLSEVKTSGGDFAQDELAGVVNTPARNRLIVSKWNELGQKRQTVAFTVDIQHARDLAAEFEGAGVIAAAVWGNDPDRAEKLRLHRFGKIQVLCNCGVLTEGYDDWQIGCIILARPTKSGVLFTQMVGRGTRLQEGLGNLKEWIKKNSLCLPYASADGGEYATPIKQDCIVIDVVDISGKHSLVTLPTLMGLQTALDLKGKSLVGAVQAIEQAQKDHPNADFGKLTDIDGLKAFVESIDMFDVRFPEIVEECSDLSWYKVGEDTYQMLIPKSSDSEKTGSVKIFQNLLDQWEIVGNIRGQQFHGIRTSIEESFKVADEQVRERVPNVLKLVSRKATWHEQPATVAQLKLLKKFYPYKSFPNDLGRGQASRLIGEKLAGKAK